MRLRVAFGEDRAKLGARALKDELVRLYEVEIVAGARKVTLERKTVRRSSATSAASTSWCSPPRTARCRGLARGSSALPRPPTSAVIAMTAPSALRTNPKKIRVAVGPVGTVKNCAPRRRREPRAVLQGRGGQPRAPSHPMRPPRAWLSSAAARIHRATSKPSALSPDARPALRHHRRDRHSPHRRAICAHPRHLPPLSLHLHGKQWPPPQDAPLTRASVNAGHLARFLDGTLAGRFRA